MVEDWMGVGAVDHWRRRGWLKIGWVWMSGGGGRGGEKEV